MENKKKRVNFKPSITQYNFIMSQSFENCLMGPRGEGKTEAGLVAVTYHASLQDPQYRPIIWGLVRDTWSNLERTTLQSFLAPRPESFAASIRDRLQVKEGGRRLILPGFWEIWLFGCDTPQDLNKFQSMQLGGVWMEEAAPAMGTLDIGSGISEAVWLMSLTSLRQPVTTQRRAQVTENYPSEDHWTWQRFHEFPDDTRKLFRIPRGENEHIDVQYRRNLEEALRDRPDMYKRLVVGEPAMPQMGEVVMPEYTDRHRSDEIFKPIKGVQVIRFWDGGLTPSCVFAQITPRGQFRVLDCVVGRNQGMMQLIKTTVKPLINERYRDITSWRDLGDPNIAKRDESDSSHCAMDEINGELGANFERGVSDWSVRRESFKELLNRMVDGKPMFQVSRHCNFLHKALSSGWHYFKTAAGVIQRDLPVKNEYSHPCDALSHGIPKIFEYRSAMPEINMTKYKNRSTSYGHPDINDKRRGSIIL